MKMMTNPPARLISVPAHRYQKLLGRPPVVSRSHRLTVTLPCGDRAGGGEGRGGAFAGRSGDELARGDHDADPEQHEPQGRRWRVVEDETARDGCDEVRQGE